MSSPDSALTGFYARASADADMKTILGTKPTVGSARIFEGFPVDTLTRTDCPRATYWMPSSLTRRPGFYSVRLQVDGWFWPEAGFAAQRGEWTARMEALFDEQTWVLDGDARLYATVLPGTRDMPEGPGDPARRKMELRIEVSPA